MTLKRAKKYNNIIFDVNDLKCEQYKDLEINKYNLNRVQEVENELFKLDAKYIFASNSMRDYAVKKYRCFIILWIFDLFNFKYFTFFLFFFSHFVSAIILDVPPSFFLPSKPLTLTKINKSFINKPQTISTIFI